LINGDSHPHNNEKSELLKQGDKRVEHSIIKTDSLSEMQYIDLSHIKRIRKRGDRLEILLATRDAIANLPFEKKRELFEMFGDEKDLIYNVSEVCVRALSQKHIFD
jgi:hypothetical protein